MDAADAFARIFPAKVTSSAAGSAPFAGQTVFSWQEQVIDPSSGALTLAVPGRSGTATVSPAFEENNQTPASFPFWTWMRLRGMYAGMPTYEFVLGGSPLTVAYSDHSLTIAPTTLLEIDKTTMSLTNPGAGIAELSVPGGSGTLTAATMVCPTFTSFCVKDCSGTNVTITVVTGITVELTTYAAG